MPNPVEGRLEVCEDMVEVLLVLEIFLTQDSYVENLLCGAFSCPERSPLKKRKKPRPEMFHLALTPNPYM